MENEHRKRGPGRPPIDELAEGERREQFLRAADELFGRRGYAAVSIGDVAAAVGVSKAALYHHFPSKAALFAAVMCRALGLIAAGIRRAAAEPGPVADKIHRLAVFPIVYLEDDADMDAMMRDADEHLSPVQRAEIAAAEGPPHGEALRLEALGSVGDGDHRTVTGDLGAQRGHPGQGQDVVSGDRGHEASFLPWG